MARAAVLLLLLAAPAVAQEGESQQEPKRPAPFEDVVDAVAPGRWLRRLDERAGRDAGDESPKPRSPEIPLATFFESIRPLGGLKYETQVSYRVAAYTGDAPTFQTVTYDYVFADWNAARLEVVAPAGRVDALGFGYQRTLGVGADGRFVHGALVLPEVSLTGSGFVGGSALYTAGFKPERESPWTLAASVGANRASFSTRPLADAPAAGVGTMGMTLMGATREQAERQPEAEKESRVWRPLAAGNLFYAASRSLTLGLELDAFAHPTQGEYLALPNLTWRPVEHFFLQAGAGWYEVGGRSQAAFVVRVNLLDPSPRRGR